MKRRFTIPVAHTTYIVVFDKGLKEDGECDFTNRIIKVKPKDHRDAERYSILHEWHHALCHELGYDKLCVDEAYIESMVQPWMRLREEVPWL